MSWNGRIRQTHRWLGVAFTVTVIANIVVMSLRPGQPPDWVTYSPLLPLGLPATTRTAPDLPVLAAPTRFAYADPCFRFNPPDGVRPSSV